MNKFAMIVILLVLVIFMISNILLTPLSKISWTEPLFIPRKVGVGLTVNLENSLGWWTYVICSLILSGLLFFIVM